MCHLLCNAECIIVNIVIHIFSQEPNIDTCLMSKIKSYDVNISSDDGKSVSMETNSTDISFSPSKLNNKSNVSYILTIVVYNSEEMSSHPTTKNFGKQITYSYY